LKDLARTYESTYEPEDVMGTDSNEWSSIWLKLLTINDLRNSRKVATEKIVTEILLNVLERIKRVGMDLEWDYDSIMKLHDEIIEGKPPENIFSQETILPTKKRQKKS
jgi:hypothetical protein